MKNVFLLFFALAALSSCANFYTDVTAEKELESLDSDEPVYLYYADDQDVPESATFIGEFTTEYKPTSYVAPTQEELAESIASEILDYGGNLAMIEKDKSLATASYLKGKVYYYKSNLSASYTEEKLTSLFKSKTTDKLEGIYELPIEQIVTNYSGYKIKYGIVKTDESNYLMVYLGGFEDMLAFWRIHRLDNYWREGDIAAFIKKSATPGLYEIRIVDYNKYVNQPTMAKFENGYFRTVSNHGLQYFRQILPTTAKYEEVKADLTGFGVGDGRVVTCYHGVNDREKTKEIYVKGINGDFETRHRATLEAYDRDNDLAVIRLNEPGAIQDETPLCIANATKNPGEEVFIMGYPISTALGEEIKITNGIVSSTTGYTGLANTYQISAPAQPGNSGSPLFDASGNLIGVVNAVASRTDNIAYSIKSSYLKDFFEKNKIECKTQPENALKSLSLPEKVSKLRKSIYLIEVIDTKQPDDEEHSRYIYVSPWDYLD